MEEIKLSDDVIEQIKYFNHMKLTEEQELLIDKIILNDELKKRYKQHGLCTECKQLNTVSYWCQSCNAKRFQQNFRNWTSENHDIDEFIQKAQLKAKNYKQVLEWIDYNRFENIENLAKGIYKANWLDGYICNWDPEDNQWYRWDGSMCALKCLHNSQDNTIELLKEIDSDCAIRCYGFAKNPETNNFIMVMDLKYIKYGVCKECGQLNTAIFWCQPCNAQHFQQNFKNWTSENRDIDELIQNAQLKAKNYWNLLEWINYDRFENVEYLAKSEFETTYKANWKDGYIFSWDSENNQWERYKENYKKGQPVTLKCFHDSQDITDEFIRKIDSWLIMSNSFVVFYYGITKHPDSNNFMMVYNIEEFRFSGDIFEQIKDFNRRSLTREQDLLIDKLILNEELKKWYKEHGLCKECKQLNTGNFWCQSCNAKHFQQNFRNWTSGNYAIDKFIQKAQHKAKNYEQVLEWIDYNGFENIENLAKGIYKAHCLDGFIRYWDSGNNQWNRWGESMKVGLKYLHNSQDNTIELLREIEVNNTDDKIHSYGFTKDPETNNFIMVLNYSKFIKHGVCKECGQSNTAIFWCQPCNAQHFQQNFKNWTSENRDIDELIQNAQLKAKNYWNLLEWINYDRFENVEYLAKSEFETTYKANWKDGYIFSWDFENNQWERYKVDYKKGQPVTLKCFHDSQDITDEFIRKIDSQLIMSNSFVFFYYGITKHPESNNFMMVYNMEEFRFSDDVFEQIKDFNHVGLTEEKDLLIDKIILNEELKKHYKKHGLCKGCKQLNTVGFWCQPCNAKRFQQNFRNWTSGNYAIDEFIQKTQLKAKNHEQVLEWIDYNRFENIENLAKGIYKAHCLDGFMQYWDSGNNQWIRWGKSMKVALKYLHNSQDNTIKLLREIDSDCAIRCYGFTKNPETNSFIMVMDIEYIKYGVCKECGQLNTAIFWCQPCNSQHFQQNFKNWTSENRDIDELIQNAQLKAKNYWNLLEWIDYDRFQNVEYLAKSEFETTYKATWEDGYIFSWDSENNQWDRYKEDYKNGQPVTLKCFHDSQDITDEFLRKIDSQLVISDSFVVPYCGITKHPDSNNFMMVYNIEEFRFSDYAFEQIKGFHHKYLTKEQDLLIDKLILNEELKISYKEYGLCKECKQLNTGSDGWRYWCQSCNAKRFQQNFRNWTSGNHNIDEFIQNTQLKAKSFREVLEWIDYNRFENVKYLAKGGFGITYKASWKDGYIKCWDSENNQWKREGEIEVALKCLHNSQDIEVEFLKEIKSHLVMNNTDWVVTCFGITIDPETNNFMMVMQYAENGSLRQHLNNNFNSLKWVKKLSILRKISGGLKDIHDSGLIHQNFHCGNILSYGVAKALITGLGLCQPANVKSSQSDNKQIFGVLPYVAPEVLRGKIYTQSSDIYGFGIIAYEICTGLPPYLDMAHRELLAISICQGLRPKSNYKIPQLILDIIKQCWDADPSKRPKAEVLYKLLEKLHYDAEVEEDSLIYKQIQEADDINKHFSSSTTSSSSTDILSYTIHPQAVYTSRLLDFKNLPEPKNAEFSEYSESSTIDFIQLDNSKDESN